MEAKENFYKLHAKKFEIFKSQNPEDGKFDVVFEVESKKLYAHKFMLCSVSTTFESMLSERWSKPDEPIKIETYSFEDFKELLIFIYSGECELTENNIFSMVDLAEFYGVDILKEVCEEFLVEMEINHENIYHMMEFAHKFSLMKLKKVVDEFASNNFFYFVQSTEFQDLSKAVVKDFVELNQEAPGHEELFQAVYEWAEKRVFEKQEDDKSFILNDAIKEELTEFLRFFNFERMNDVFFIKFIVSKSFLFSGNVLSNIIWNRCSKHVKITDENGKAMKGKLQCDDVEKVMEMIQLKRNVSCVAWNSYYYWDTKQQKSTKPYKFIKSDKCDWYLVYDHQGDLAVKQKRQVQIDFDEILAEMFPESGFKLSEKCKIEVYCFA